VACSEESELTVKKHSVGLAVPELKKLLFCFLNSAECLGLKSESLVSK
jgi:hypothetical protein